MSSIHIASGEQNGCGQQVQTRPYPSALKSLQRSRERCQFNEGQVSFNMKTDKKKKRVYKGECVTNI